MKRQKKTEAQRCWRAKLSAEKKATVRQYDKVRAATTRRGQKLQIVNKKRKDRLRKAAHGAKKSLPKDPQKCSEVLTFLQSKGAQEVPDLESEEIAIVVNKKLCIIANLRRQNRVKCHAEEVWKLKLEFGNCEKIKNLSGANIQYI